MAGATLEEVDEGPVEIPESLLERLGIGLLEPLHAGLPFQLGQLFVEFDIAERLARRLIVLLLPRQAPIPDEAAGARQSVQGLPLPRIGPHPESVDLAVERHGSDSLLVLDVLLDHGRGRTADGADEVGVRPEGREPAPEPGELLPQEPARSPLAQLDESVDSELRI